MDAKVRFISHLCNSDFSSFATQYSQLACYDDCFGRVVAMQFVQDTLPMIVDCIGANIQQICYLLTCLAAADQLQDSTFTNREKTLQANRRVVG